MKRSYTYIYTSVLLSFILTISGMPAGSSASNPAESNILHLHNEMFQVDALINAVVDLQKTFGDAYPNGSAYLEQIRQTIDSKELSVQRKIQILQDIQQEALLANPLLQDKEILLIKRKPLRTDRKTFYKNHDPSISFSKDRGFDIGMPSNHECNASLPRSGYENEIAVLSAAHPRAPLRTLFQPEDGGYVGEIDLHWDGDRFLFTRSNRQNWTIWEMDVDGKNRRQISQTPSDVDCFDACYTPGGRIVFGSDASFQSVPCWHGKKRVSNLYIMDAQGGHMRQICFDQDHDFHPAVLNNGQILYNRWDYTGISHIFLRELMVMNPDGTGQRAVYGSNSWFPNSLYFTRPIPHHPSQFISILSGYHGDHRMGQLVLLDPQKGWYNSDGLIKRISGKGQSIQVQYKDALVNQDWPKFLHPFPISEKHFLAAAWLNEKSSWGIYLADSFDNLVLIREEPGWALLEPVLMEKRRKPPRMPDRVDLSRDDAVVYLQDVHIGRGLQGVPRGVVKQLRVMAFHFGYYGLAGPDKVGYGGPWEVMRILGTVDLEKDGSAIFTVPANTPIALQALDQEGKAIQLMRSWFTAMPGEKVSCIGCHENPNETPLLRQTASSLKTPQAIQPWHGPARGFDFTREIQPVLNRYCVSCHNGDQETPLDLRPIDQAPEYEGVPISKLGLQRLHPEMLADFSGKLKFTPAYDALIHYIRRVNIEDDVNVLTPGEYHADTSELIQLLQKGHYGVKLDPESMDRLVVWIDLNAPCFGTWRDIHPLAERLHKRRKESWRMYGGPKNDPERIPAVDVKPSPPAAAQSTPRSHHPISLPGWPLDAHAAAQNQKEMGEVKKVIALGGGASLQMVKIPAGFFVMGDESGRADESPTSAVKIEEPFWMSSFEITNEQFRLFDPSHDSGYYVKRHARADDRGRTLNDPDQPVVRVSWQEAMEFCRWLTNRTQIEITLPTEAQWEYACRAGSDAPLHYGDENADFSPWGNMADASFAKGFDKNGNQITGGLHHLVLEGAKLSDARFNDHAVVTAPVGNFQPSIWGLYDMHGNAAEWTLSEYSTSFNSDKTNLIPGDLLTRRVVRGGSFFDRPARCRSALRLAYRQWQKVFNVGFRVVSNGRG